MGKKIILLIILIALAIFYFKGRSVHSNIIKLGGSIPKTGVIKEWGKAVSNGANAYFEYTNDNNLLNGKKIDYILYDDKYEPELTYKNTEKLIYKDKVFALFGFVGTPTVKNVLPLIIEENIPFISSFSGASFLRDEKNNNFVNFRASYEQEIENLIKYLHYNKKINRFAVFYQNDDFGEEGYISLIKSLKKRDLKLIAEGSYKRNTLSIRHAFNEIKGANPEAIIMMGADKANSLFIKKAKENPNFKNTIFCNISFGDANAMLKHLDDSKNLIFSQVLPNYNDTSIPVIREYHQIMSKYIKDFKPGFISLEAFLSAKLVVKAIQSIKGELTQKRFISALENVDKNTLEGIPLNFKNKQLLNSVFLYKYKNDKFEEIKR